MLNDEGSALGAFIRLRTREREGEAGSHRSYVGIKLKEPGRACGGFEAELNKHPGAVSVRIQRSKPGRRYIHIYSVKFTARN